MKNLIYLFLLMLASPAMAQNGSNTLNSGGKLTEGQRLVSANKSYYLTVQADGNVCIYSSSNAFVWCTMATKGKGSSLVLQTDGNLVVNDSKNQPVWASQTQGFYDAKYRSADWKPVRGVLENEGVLSLYSSTNKKVWSTPATKVASNTKGPYRFEVVIKNADAIKNKVISSTAGRKVPYTIKQNDIVRVVTYTTTQTPMFDFADGSIYFLFNPQSAVWQKWGQKLTRFNVTGYTSTTNYKPAEFRDGDYYALNAQQDTPEDAIDLTWEVFRLVNGKQVTVASFSAKTEKGAKWPE